MCKCKRFLYVFFSFFVGTTASIYLAEEKYGIADVLKKKKTFYIIAFILKRMTGK